MIRKPSSKFKGAVDLHFNLIMSWLEKDKPFSFSRWGDGEFALIKGSGKVYDGVVKKQGKEVIRHTKLLRKILESNPTYYIGIQHLAYRQEPELIDQYTSNLRTFNADVIHHASMQNEQNNKFQNLVDLLSTKNLIIVGPKYLSKVPLKFTHIVTPTEGIWNLDKKLLDELSSINLSNKVILYSAATLSNYLIHKLHSNGTHMDMGAVWEPYCGMKVRGYHSLIKTMLLDPRRDK